MNHAEPRRQALADKIRLQHVRSTRRQRLTITTLITLGVVGCIAFAFWLQKSQDTPNADVAAPKNANEAFGFTLSPPSTTENDTGENDTAENDDTDTAAEARQGEPISVALYEDYLCSTCAVFHQESAPYLAEQLAAGTISISYHPFVFLLTQSTTEYAQRAANAAVCVADQAGVPAYATMHALLLENQPAQGGPGLSDEQLIDFAAQSGATEVSECVRERTFSPWLEQALQAGITADVSSTPTVRVNGLNVVRSSGGRESMPGPEELRFAIEALQ